MTDLYVCYGSSHALNYLRLVVWIIINLKGISQIMNVVLLEGMHPKEV